MDGSTVSVERVIPAPPERIFALLADPSRHTVIDGSGAVKGLVQPSPGPLGLGDTFGMHMRMGLPYKMVNTVIEYEANRRIAWQTKLSGPLGGLVGGRVWRYQLEPVDGGTRVTETWDISADKQRPLLKLGGMPTKTEAGMNKTLDRITDALG